MCVSKMRSPEKCMRTHFPSATTLSTVRPLRGESKATRESLGNTVSNSVTRCPASARCRVRAARKMVSPSGIRPSRQYLNRFRLDHFLSRRALDDLSFHRRAGRLAQLAAFEISMQYLQIRLLRGNPPRNDRVPERH